MHNFFLQSIIQRRVQKYSLYSDQKLFHLKENGTYNFPSSHTLHTDFQVMKWDQEITSGFSICQWHMFCKFIENLGGGSTMNSPRKTTYHCQFFFSIRFSYLWSTYYLFKYVQHCSNGKTRPQHYSFYRLIKISISSGKQLRCDKTWRQWTPFWLAQNFTFWTDEWDLIISLLWVVYI